jgi:hypothetical protein
VKGPGPFCFRETPAVTAAGVRCLALQSVVPWVTLWMIALVLPMVVPFVLPSS